MDKFQNYYRIESARLKGWNYGRNASYFVTLCTGGRSCFFGAVVNKKMKLSGAGKIADRLWREIPAQFNYACLDEYIVMPNHIHGIIQINKPEPVLHPPPGKYNHFGNDARGGAMGIDGNEDIGRDGGAWGGRDAINRVSTIDRTTNEPNMNEPTTNDPNKNDPISNVSSPNESTINTAAPKNPGGITGNFNPMLHDNLSRILRWYKGRATFEIRKVTNDFLWQTRFHDRIIHDEEGLRNARRYIIRNPLNWENDEYNSS